MGLDQALHIHPAGRSVKTQPIQVWRKHPNLQGMIEGIWSARDEANNADNMNCCPVYLSEEDICHILEMIKSNKLPPTTGFFYGGDSSDYYREEDEKAFTRALEALHTGFEVFYLCWW